MHIFVFNIREIQRTHAPITKYNGHLSFMRTLKTLLYYQTGVQRNCYWCFSICQRVPNLTWFNLTTVIYQKTYMPTLLGLKEVIGSPLRESWKVNRQIVTLHDICILGQGWQAFYKTFFINRGGWRRQSWATLSTKLACN